MTRGLAMALAAAVLLTAGCKARRPAPATVQLLAINDFHGNLAPPDGSDGRVGATPAGGADTSRRI